MCQLYVNFSVPSYDLFAAVPCDTRPNPPRSCHYRSSSFAMAPSPASVSLKALLELREVRCHQNWETSKMVVVLRVYGNTLNVLSTRERAFVSSAPILMWNWTTPNHITLKFFTNIKSDRARADHKYVIGKESCSDSTKPFHSFAKEVGNKFN